jgi:UrcA family protein
MKTIVIALATLLSGLTATAEASTAVHDMRQQVVSYADLNLDSAADAETLLRRIKSAARKVCGTNASSPLGLVIMADLVRCADQATARAIEDVNVPMLTRQALRTDAQPTDFVRL